MNKDFYASLLYAWKHSFCIRIPDFLLYKTQIPQTVPDNMRTVMPAAGGIAGAILWLISLVFCLLFPQGIASLLAGLVCTFLWEWAYSWKGIGCLTALLSLKRQKYSWEEALQEEWNISGLSADPVSLLTGFSIFLLRAILTGALLYSGMAWWLIAVPAGGFFVRAGLSILPSADGRNSFYPQKTEEAPNGYFIIFGIVLAVTGILFLHVFRCICCFLAAWGMLQAFKWLLMKNGIGIRFEHLVLFGYLTEIILLLLGLLIR